MNKTSRWEVERTRTPSSFFLKFVFFSKKRENLKDNNKLMLESNSGFEGQPIPDIYFYEIEINWVIHK